MKISTQQIGVIARRWQKRLGLTHWSIEIVEGGLDSEDAILEVERHENAHRAVIHVAPWLLEGGEAPYTSESITPEYVEQAVVHELCHLHFRDIMFTIRDDVSELLGSVTSEMLLRALNRYEEQAVDLLSGALVRSWPR